MLKKTFTFAPLFFILFLIVMGYFNGAIPQAQSDPHALYETEPSKEILFPFSFENKSDLLQNPYQELDGQPRAQPHVSVGDFNNDGFDDLMLLYNDKPSGTHWFKILENQSGRRFVDRTSHLGFENAALDRSLKSAVFIDFNNDGLLDVFITRFAKPGLFYINKGDTFTESSFLLPDVPLSDGWDIAVLDYNNDGFLDLFVFNYYNSEHSPTLKVDQYAHNSFANEYDGGPNFLLMNVEGKRFDLAPQAGGLNAQFFSQIAAISDFNNDFCPDIYIGVDYGFDRLFINDCKGQFKNESRLLGKIRSRYSMSGTPIDFDNNGQMDLYSSNVNKAGHTKGYNSLWQITSNQSNIKFTDVAEKTSTAKCGWSWGTVAIDINKDGWQDIAVVNGRHGKIKTNHWFLINESYKSNVLLKKLGLTGITFQDTLATLAPGQKSCLFISDHGKKFVDAAISTGINDTENGRSIAVLDFNNDGNEDLIVGNIEHSEILYQGHRHNKNHWLGLKLVGKKSNRWGYGAKVFLASNLKTQMRELYTTNGYLSQSTNRLLFGLEEKETPISLFISWPSGIQQKFTKFPLNKYLEIHEDTTNETIE